MCLRTENLIYKNKGHTRNVGDLEAKPVLHQTSTFLIVIKQNKI